MNKQTLDKVSSFEAEAAELHQRSRTAVRGDTACLDLWYPEQREVKFVQLGLMAFRAVDDIRISYDFDRDGWPLNL